MYILVYLFIGAKILAVHFFLHIFLNLYPSSSSTTVAVAYTSSLVFLMCLISAYITSYASFSVSLGICNLGCIAVFSLVTIFILRPVDTSLIVDGWVSCSSLKGQPHICQSRINLSAMVFTYHQMKTLNFIAYLWYLVATSLQITFFRMSTIKAPQNDLLQATSLNTSDQTFRNILNKGGLKA